MFLETESEFCPANSDQIDDNRLYFPKPGKAVVNESAQNWPKQIRFFIFYQPNFPTNAVSAQEY